MLSSINATLGFVFSSIPSGEVGRNGQHPVQPAIAEVGESLALIAVFDGVERAGVCGDGPKELAAA